MELVLTQDYTDKLFHAIELLHHQEGFEVAGESGWQMFNALLNDMVVNMS